MNFKDRLSKYVKHTKFKSGNPSKLWNSFIPAFQHKNTSLRGYGLSTLSMRQIKLYRALNKLFCFPFRKIIQLSNKLKILIKKFLSFLILGGDLRAADKYGFSSYKAEIYSDSELSEFLEKYSKHNIGFSHNTFKTYSYLKRLENNIGIEGDLSIFEIGAGVFNFGHLISFQLSKFEYIVCDLPEMIVSAYREINNKYIALCGGNYEVFLPNEIEEFENSKSDRKVLFITPEQLNDGILGTKKRFDLFINHESFGEMDIDIVNSYLAHLPSIMKKGGIVNIVNRHNRPQCNSYEDFKQLKLENITCFDDYKLDFCDVVVKEIDTFAASIHGQQHFPNVFYIGKVSK